MATRAVSHTSSPVRWSQTRPSRRDVWLTGYGSTFSRSVSSPEQYAVQELTKAAMSGVGIDGEVLSYLELAQVCNSLPFTFSVCSTSSFNADKTFRCCICLNKDVTTESQRALCTLRRSESFTFHAPFTLLGFV